MRPDILLKFGLATLVVVLDQLSKVWITQTFRPFEVLPVTDFFNLILVFNQGAAFSFLSDAGGWQRWALSFLALVVSVVLIVWITRLGEKEKLQAWALAFVLGGAVGNLLDRVRLGHVIDFLDFYWQQWHWPAFNLADSAITLGVMLLLLDMFRGASKKENNNAR